MRISEDETDEEIFHDACFAVGMCCLKLASGGGEITRERLGIELMRLLGACIEKREECPSSLLFAIDSWAGSRMRFPGKPPSPRKVAYEGSGFVSSGFYRCSPGHPNDTETGRLFQWRI